MTMSTDTAVRERPILFSGEMVRAILDGRKTQTRPVVSDHNSFGNYRASELDLARAWVDGCKLKAFLTPETNARQGFAPDEIVERLYPRIAPVHEWDQTPDPRDGYVPPASRLWVRETWCDSPDGVIYRATEYEAGMHGPDDYNIWRPSIHMPRKYSRLTLEITEVRVQRLQEISEEDAIAEGCFDEKAHDGSLPSEVFRYLWDSLNAKRGYSWDSNPWVWAISFRPSYQPMSRPSSAVPPISDDLEGRTMSGSRVQWSRTNVPGEVEFTAECNGWRLYVRSDLLRYYTMVDSGSITVNLTSFDDPNDAMRHAEDYARSRDPNSARPMSGKR